MSGHSKWHNIRVKKTAQDAKRGKVYTRHARLIEMAARAGGGDTDTNAGLRTAVENAKAENVPNANIDRAIKKGTGESKGAMIEEVTYAAMGPGNTAMLIECLTDNRNRTLSNVKIAVTKNGGNWAETSSVAWLFERKGLVEAERGEGNAFNDDLELALIDAGAEDIDHDADNIQIVTDIAAWQAVRKVLADAGWNIETAGVKQVANQHADIDNEQTAEKLGRLIDAIEDDDDVSEVFTNAKVHI